MSYRWEVTPAFRYALIRGEYRGEPGRWQKCSLRARRDGRTVKTRVGVFRLGVQSHGRGCAATTSFTFDVSWPKPALRVTVRKAREIAFEVVVGNWVVMRIAVPVVGEMMERPDNTITIQPSKRWRKRRT